MLIRAMLSVMILGLASNYAHATENSTFSEPFKGYKKVAFYERQRSSYDPQILVEKGLSYKRIEESYLEFKCGKNNLYIEFDNGPSDDYGFVLSVNPKEQDQGMKIDGTFIAISNNCTVYISGNDNQFYNVRRKFKVNSKGITEVKQPFYLVDEVCEASETFELKTQKCGNGESIAKIPKGEKVQILLAERHHEFSGDTWVPACKERSPMSENYLVRTPFGLVGWVVNFPGTITGFKGQPLSCIIYNGD